MSHFPLETKPRTSMVIDLSGVLSRAAENIKRDYRYLEHPLSELNKHIEHLRASSSDQEALERLEAFLRLWV